MVTFCVDGRPRMVRKVKLVGETESLTPLPLRLTGEPATGTLAVTVSVPFTAPAAFGENTTLIVQEVSEARVPPQVPPDRVKRGDEKARVIPVRVDPPVLLRVSVWAALVVPIVTSPKDSGPPVMLATAGPALPVNSTAPASTALLPFLGLPK
jgi:hypothetical protein